MKKLSHEQDVFFQYPLTNFNTSVGDIELPILYYDNSVCMAIYLVDIEKARPLVTDERLEVVRCGNNKALVGISFYEYRHTAIGSYNEAGVAVLVAPRGVATPRIPILTLLGPLDKNPMGFYIVDLPVTTAAACSAGKEVWGLPKFVTPIYFSLQDKRFNGSVQHPTENYPIVTLEGQGGLCIPGPLLDLSLYSVLDDKLLRALVNTRGGAKIMLGGSLRLNVHPESNHPMAERLRQLGLSQSKPLFACASHSLQLRLNTGVAVPT